MFCSRRRHRQEPSERPVKGCRPWQSSRANRCALRQVVLVQRLADERLDHRLAAHVQLRRLVEFREHGGGEIHVHPLNRGTTPTYLSSFIAEKLDELYP